MYCETEIKAIVFGDMHDVDGLIIPCPTQSRTQGLFGLIIRRSAGSQISPGYEVVSHL